MNFSDIRNYLYNKAELYWWISTLLGLSVQLISILSLFFPSPNFVGFLSALLFFTPIVGMWLQEASKDSASKGSKCRLAILYSDALGQDIPSDISREIKSWVKGGKIAHAPFERPYYDSKLPVGATRLADIVSESAFWTYNLAGSMRKIMWIYGGVYLISAICLIIYFLQSSLNPNDILSIIKVILSFATLIFTSEIGLLIKQYNDLYIDAKQVYIATSRMKDNKKLSITQVMQTVETYNISLISSPPIPSLLYKFRQNDLNKAYKEVITNE